MANQGKAAGHADAQEADGVRFEKKERTVEKEGRNAMRLLRKEDARQSKEEGKVESQTKKVRKCPRASRDRKLAKQTGDCLAYLLPAACAPCERMSGICASV